MEPSSTRNRVLNSLRLETRDFLRPFLVPIHLQTWDVIQPAGAPIRHIHFLDSGLVSMMKIMEDGRCTEVGTVGHEGLTHAGSLLDPMVAFANAVVRIPGKAYRIECGVLREAMDRDDFLRHLILRYVQFNLFQFTQNSACNCLHTLERRCGRWLLESGDHSANGVIHMTHDELAMMLGAPRSSITKIFNLFAEKHMIATSRRSITIVDRQQIAPTSCECYEGVKQARAAVFEMATEHSI